MHGLGQGASPILNGLSRTIWEVFEEERPKLIPYRGRLNGLHAVAGLGVQDLPGAVRQQ